MANLLNRFGNFLARKSGNLQIGLVILIVWGWAYLRPETIFPVNTLAYQARVQTWITFFGFAIIMAGTIARDYIGDLFRIAFLRKSWKFPLFAGIFGVLFYLFISLVKGQLLTPIYLLSLPLIMFYTFFNSYPEQLVFFGIIPRGLRGAKWNKFAQASFSIIVFTLFHYALGRSALTLLFYIPLGALFWFINDSQEKKGDLSHFADAGVHFAWNMVLFLFGIA
jgi:hypothetical protein